MTRLAIVGGGQIGEALLAGAVRAGADPRSILVVEPRGERAAYLAETHGVRTATDVEPEASDLGGTGLSAADVVVIAVKPHDVAAALRSVGPRLGAGAVVVSVAAGVTLRAMESVLPPRTAVVRVMPNTPMLVGHGMAAMTGGAHATPRHLELASDLLGGVGDVVRVPERQFDAVTAVSGSGPAYVFYLVEAMIDAAVAEGLPRDLARRLVVGTAVGAATMLRETGRHPVDLREAVSSPGGTTTAAIDVFENRAVRAAVRSAVRAAARRSAEMAGPGQDRPPPGDTAESGGATVPGESP